MSVGNTCSSHAAPTSSHEKNPLHGNLWAGSVGRRTHAGGEGEGGGGGGGGGRREGLRED